MHDNIAPLALRLALFSLPPPQVDTASLSETAQWMSAIGAMQTYMSDAAATPSSADTRVADAPPGMMRLSVEVPEVSVTLRASASSRVEGGVSAPSGESDGCGADRPITESPPTARLALTNLSLQMATSDDELKLELQLGAISLTAAASPGVGQPGGAEAISVLVLQADAPAGSRGFLELGVACVAVGSPGFEAATAMAALQVALRPLSLTLTPQVLQNIGGLAMRLGPQFEKISNDNDVEASSSMQQAFAALDVRRCGFGPTVDSTLRIRRCGFVPTWMADMR